MTKLITRVKDYSDKKRLEKLGLNIKLKRRMGGNLTETFKIINGISNDGGYFFNISCWTGKLLSRRISKN